MTPDIATRLREIAQKMVDELRRVDTDEHVVRVTEKAVKLRAIANDIEAECEDEGVLSLGQSIVYGAMEDADEECNTNNLPGYQWRSLFYNFLRERLDAFTQKEEAGND